MVVPSLLVSCLLLLGIFAILPLNNTSAQSEKLTVTSQDMNGSPIYGFYTLYCDGGVTGFSNGSNDCVGGGQQAVLQTGYTSVTFANLYPHPPSNFAVDSYGHCFFNHWLGEPASSQEYLWGMTFIEPGNQTLTAVYDCNTNPNAFTLTVNSVNQNNTPISGYYVSLYNSAGKILKSGYTPVTFQTTAGDTYYIKADNYGNCSVKYVGTTYDNPAQIISLSSAQTFTVTYNCGILARQNIRINSVDQNGHAITGYHWILYDYHHNQIATGFTPSTVSEPNNMQYYLRVDSYGSCTFAKWSDGVSVNPTAFILTNPGQNMTGVYNCGGSAASTISVSTVNSAGGPIDGYYIALFQDGAQIKSCFSTCSFAVNNGQTYQVVADSYGSETFNHWQNDGSTGAETVIVPSTSATISLTAVYSP